MKRQLWDIVRNAAAGALKRLAGCGFAPPDSRFAFRHAPGRPSRRTAGFTLIEIAFAVEVMMLLTLIGFNESRRVQEHARVAACLSLHVTIQRNLWSEYAVKGDFPANINAMLAGLPQSSVTNDFDYKGGLPNAMDGDYYLRCQHDHSYVAVMFTDSGAFLPPKAIYALASARGNI